jgi:hypothetical protein
LGEHDTEISWKVKPCHQRAASRVERERERQTERERERERRESERKRERERAD